MANPKDTLELRLEHAATPQRVAKATAMLAEILSQIVPDDSPSDGSAATPTVTVVVSNFNTRATVRVWDPTIEPKVDVLASFIKDPSDGQIADSFAPAAMALAKYARAEAPYKPSFWTHRDGQGSHLRLVDDAFADEIEKAVKHKRRIVPRVLGATYISSRIFRAGRQYDGAPFTIRILLDGDYANVIVDEAAVPLFMKAFEEGKTLKEYRVKMVGTFLRRDGGVEFTPDNKLRATFVDDRVTSGGALTLLDEMDKEPILKRGEAANLLRRLRGGDEDE